MSAARPETVSPTDAATAQRESTHATEPAFAGGTLDMDTVFGMLKNDRRREVLRYLRRHDGTTTLREVAEHIAGKENGIPVAQITSKQRKRVYVSLYQVHLPGMDRAGVVSFNRARGLIELTPAAADLFVYLDGTGPTESRWSHYLTLTTFGGLLYLFGSLLLGPSSVFVSIAVLGLVTGVLALAVVDVLHGRRAADRPFTATRSGTTAVGAVVGALRADGGHSESETDGPRRP